MNCRKTLKKSCFSLLIFVQRVEELEKNETLKASLFKRQGEHFYKKRFFTICFAPVILSRSVSQKTLRPESVGGSMEHAAAAVSVQLLIFIVFHFLESKEHFLLLHWFSHT